MLNIGKNPDLDKLAEEAYYLLRPDGLDPTKQYENPFPKHMLVTAKNWPTRNGVVYALHFGTVFDRALNLTVMRDSDGMHYVADDWRGHGSWSALFQRAGIVATPRPA